MQKKRKDCLPPKKETREMWLEFFQAVADVMLTVFSYS